MIEFQTENKNGISFRLRTNIRGEKMRKRRGKPLLILFLGGLISCVIYYLDAYPTMLLRLAKDFIGMGIGVLILLYGGLLFCYLAFFIWPNMPGTLSVVMSVLFVLFLNMCFISLKSPHPLGIVFLLAGAIFMLIAEMLARKKRL